MRGGNSMRDVNDSKFYDEEGFMMIGGKETGERAWFERGGNSTRDVKDGKV